MRAHHDATCTSRASATSVVRIFRCTTLNRARARNQPCMGNSDHGEPAIDADLASAGHSEDLRIVASARALGCTPAEARVIVRAFAELLLADLRRRPPAGR